MRRLLIAFVAVAVWSSPCLAKTVIKYAVGVYHYNLQYVAGDKTVENRIIEHGFDPLMDMFLRHPTWGADIELQGYMIDTMAERYPGSLGKLRTLASRGQVDVVSFHYSDQLFLAYPRHDMDWSARLNDEAFARHGIKKSNVVFTQEGQFGEGMSDLMTRHGQEILVLPKNLYRYYQNEQPASPYYALRKVWVVLSSRDVNYEDTNAKVNLHWTYCDDAELLPTGRGTPYASGYHYRPEILAKYENELETLEKSGYRIGNLSEYIRDVRAAAVPAATLLPVPDGTWQPTDTDNVFRWMGDHIGQHERDAQILSGNIASRHFLLAAETATAKLKADGKDVTALEKKVSDGWRMQSLAEVSDSTGWTPLPVEVKYSRDLSHAVAESAKGILDEVKRSLGAKFLEIDTRSGVVKSIELIPAEDAPPEGPCPVDFTLVGELKSSSIICCRMSENLWRVDVRIETRNWYANLTRLSFPFRASDITYSPALLDNEVVRAPLRSLIPEKNDIYIPAANGLLGIGKDLYVIQKTDTVRLAFRVSPDAKSAGIDMRKPPNGLYEWTLFVVRGNDADALEIANRWNVTPVVRY